MPLWIIYSFLSAIFAALVAIFGKLGISKLDTLTSTALRSLIMSTVLVLTSLIFSKSLNFGALNTKALIFIILSGLAGALSWFFYFNALKMGPTTQVAVIDRLSIVFVFLLSILILKEPYTLKGLLGIILIVLGFIFTVLK